MNFYEKKSFSEEIFVEVIFADEWPKNDYFAEYFFMDDNIFRNLQNLNFGQGIRKKNYGRN